MHTAEPLVLDVECWRCGDEDWGCSAFGHLCVPCFFAMSDEHYERARALGVDWRELAPITGPLDPASAP